MVTMSMEALAQVIALTPSSPSARLLLLVIAYHIHPSTGSTSLSTQQLAAETGLSPRHLQHLLRQLDASGALVIERGGGLGDAHVYRLPSTGAMGSAGPSATAQAGGRTPEDRVSLLPTTGPRGGLVRAVGPHLPPAARGPAKRCGWGSCEALVCPHEVNFCATHACCQACAASPPSVG